jgi:Putative citrate transport
LVDSVCGTSPIDRAPPTLRRAFFGKVALVAGFWTAIAEILHAVLLEYLPFIIVLFALFVVAGGIRIAGNLVGTPGTLASAPCRRAFSARLEPRWC